MSSEYEYCPKCQRIQRLNISLSLKRITDDAGKETDLLLLNYHCEICQGFIYQKPLWGEEQSEAVKFIESEPALLVS